MWSSGANNFRVEPSSLGLHQYKHQMLCYKLHGLHGIWGGLTSKTNMLP